MHQDPKRGMVLDTVYIKEAHPEDEWQMDSNEVEAWLAERFPGGRERLSDG